MNYAQLDEELSRLSTSMAEKEDEDQDMLKDQIHDLIWKALGDPQYEWLKTYSDEVEEQTEILLLEERPYEWLAVIQQWETGNLSGLSNELPRAPFNQSDLDNLVEILRELD